jgi:hypothetical protein
MFESLHGISLPTIFYLCGPHASGCMSMMVDTQHSWLTRRGSQPTCLHVLAALLARRRPPASGVRSGRRAGRQRSHHTPPSQTKPGRSGDTTLCAATVAGCYCTAPALLLVAVARSTEGLPAWLPAEALRLLPAAASSWACALRWAKGA